MKKSELIKLRKMYLQEYERLQKIKDLLNDEKCKQLIELSKINIDEFKEIDKLKVLHTILKNLKITETNGIYVCTGAYYIDCSICYEETTYYTGKVPIDAEYAEYKFYNDIENGKLVIGYTKPEYFREYNPKIITTDFEKSNIVLNPYNSNNNENGLYELRDEFFMNCINLGQVKSKKLLLEKYKGM